MKIPLSWLRDYVDVTLPVPQLAERLTLAGLEVSGVNVLGLSVPDGLPAKSETAGPVWERDKVIVARVLKVEKHPNADRLTLVTLDYGASEPRVVVTGAANLKVGDSGQNVILGLAGTSYLDGHSTPTVLRKLEPKAIRGIMNDAMVMSEFELGISDEHAGIIILDPDAPAPGTPVADFLGDVIIEVDVLPNMARCLGMIGAAREVAALAGQVVRLPQVKLQTAGPKADTKVRVEIENPSLSARYAAMIIQDVTVGASPQWVQRRLSNAGMRPVNNIVDVTNYTMLEWGQPLHAFDYDLLVQRANGQVPVIRVRSAHADEHIKTLDGNDRKLTPDHLVIADAKGPIAIAGVMGGADTEVTARTKNILLESANFDFKSVRRTMRHFDLPSEASVRFSRGVHPETVKPAAERAAELISRYAGGTGCPGMVDAYPAPSPTQSIDLDMAEVRRILGVEFSVTDAQRILQSLEFNVEMVGPGKLRIIPPPYRTDIQEGSADVIEELARVYGYDKLPATLIADQLPEQHTNRSLTLEEGLRDRLVNMGLQEFITYALTDPVREAPLQSPDAEYVRLLNPITTDRVVMRRTRVAGILEATAANLKHADGVHAFEIGSVYWPTPDSKLPHEPRRLAIVMTGRREEECWADPKKSAVNVEFLDLKGVIESLVEDLHLPKSAYRRAQVPFLHPGKAAELVVDTKSVGTFGELHPKVAQAFDLTDRVVLVAELDLDVLFALIPDRHAYKPVPRFPAALRDIAVIVPEETSAERLEAEIRAAGGELIGEVRLFDIYRGDSIPPGTKSLAYALAYQAKDRTLVDKEVDKAHKKIEDRLKHVLQAQIRGRDA